MTYRFPDVEGQPQVLPAPFVKMSVARPSCVMMASFIFLIMTLFFQKGKAFPGSAFHGGHGARVVCVCTLLAQHKRGCMIGGGSHTMAPTISRQPTRA